MMTDKDSSAAGTDNRPPMLEENDYKSWRIRIERYIKGKPHGKLIWKSIQNGPTPPPQTTDPAPEGDAVPPLRNKRDEEFTEEDNINELTDIQAINILSQGVPRHIFNILNQNETGREIWVNLELLMKGSGQTIERRKEALFDEFEHFHANRNELIQDYFVYFHKLINDMKVTQLDIPTHQLNAKFANNLPSIDLHPILKQLIQHLKGGVVPLPKNKRDEEFTEEDNINELADIQAINVISQGLLRRSGQTLERRKEALFDEFKSFRANGNELIQDYFVRFHKLVNDMKVTQLDIPTHQLNTKFANNLPSYWETVPTNNNQLQTSSNPKTHATVHDGQIVIETVQRRAPGNTRTKGIQTTGSGVNNSRKKVICYNCRREGHVARQCKESKRARDSHWYHDKALLMKAKEKGAVLDAEAEAFLADVECTAPYDQLLALTTTNLFEATHEDAYDFDVDDGPHASAAFMDNLSSTGGTNDSSSSHINKEEHLNSEVDSVLDENMITYDEYQNDSGVEAVPSVVSANEADKQSMIAVLQRLHTKIAGYVRVNNEHKLVNATLTAELERWRDDSIRNLQAQNGILSLLNVGSTNDSCNKQALETELTQLKDTVTYLKIQNDGYKETPKPSPRFTKKPVAPLLKKPNVNAPLSTGIKFATGASKPAAKSNAWIYRKFPAKSAKGEKLKEHIRNLNKNNRVDTHVKRSVSVKNLNDVYDACY
uniref:CCHC-type domain-containing protein n=1 Tax=Tanacetum cinerariifolium TaxID=118510 RepID=A0A6L2J5E9_TANCI|nr:hypothetical protein [Tanacetum cinerariifolium]